MTASGFTATAYGPPWDSMEGSGTTATGLKLAPAPTSNMTGPYVVAVDPSVIPLGTKLKVDPNPFGNPNIVFTAADTGGAIKGKRLDFYDPLGRMHQDAWGRRPVSIAIVGKGTVTSPAPSSWKKLLLDVAFVAFGATAIYRGARHMTQGGR